MNVVGQLKLVKIAILTQLVEETRKLVRNKVKESSLRKENLT